MRQQSFLFAGSSNQKLADKIGAHLHISLGRMHLNHFPDGETQVQILEEVRGKDVFVLQSIAGNPNHMFVELLIIIDALKRASAKTITAIIPYLGYCRQDRKDQPGVPITAKLFANVLTIAGMTHLITIDLHADQVEGFFDTFVDHLHCQALLCEQVKERMGADVVVVSPDIGGVKIAERMAKLLGSEMAMINKERLNSFDVRMEMIGNVDKKNVVIVDDLCSTAGTLVTAAQLCCKLGAKRIIAAVSHALFIGNAIERIEASPLEFLLTTDTVDIRANKTKKIQCISVAPLLAELLQSHAQH